MRKTRLFFSCFYLTTKLLVVGLFLLVSAKALSEPWQNITQPIGTLLVSPPESALAVNQYLMSLDPNITPATFPFDLSTDVTKIRTSQTLYFVRVYNESTGSFPVGSWIMRASEARGLTPAQIRNIQALPATPDHFTFVEVPEGIVMYTGVAGPIQGWGEGGATQSKMVGPPFVPRENFINRQPIGDCFLCYRVLAPSASANANRVAVALDRAIPTPYGPLDSIYNNLDMLYDPSTVGQFQSALNALSGEGATGSQTVAFGATANFVDAIAQRMAGWLYQANPTRDSAGNRSQDVAWASLTGSKSTLRGEAGAASLTASGTGLVLGVNRQIKANALVGLSVGVGSVNYDVSDRATTGTFNSMGMALYGIARLDNTYFAGTLAYGRGYTDMERNVAVNTLFNHQTGRVATDLLSLRVEAGYLASIRRLNLTPFVAIAPTWLNQGAFSETFKGSQPTMVNMGLNFQAQQASSVPVSLGFQVDSEVLLGNGWSISPLMRLSWIHEFKTARQLDASLQLLPDQPFTVYGASAPRNVGNVLLGLSATNRAGFTSYVTLSGAFSGQSQSLQAKLGISFAL